MYSRILMRTRLTPAAAEDRLRKLIRPRGSFFQILDTPDPAANSAPPFVGVIEGGRFKFHRVIKGRNSFIPIVTGSIFPAEGGAALRMTIRLAIPVAVVMSLWMTAVVFAAVQVVPRALRTSNIGEATVALALPLLGVVLYVIGFVPEARRTRRILKETFEEASGPQRQVR